MIYKLPAGSSTIVTLATFNGTNGGSPSGVDHGRQGRPVRHMLQWRRGWRRSAFELPAGSSTIAMLASFDSTNGEFPYGGLIADSQGNLYGTTFSGGVNSDGVVFKITGAGFVVPEPIGACLVVIAGVAALWHRNGR